MLFIYTFIGTDNRFCKQGGLITYTANELDAVNDATFKFSSNVTDPKAQIITTYNFVLGEVSVQNTS